MRTVVVSVELSGDTIVVGSVGSISFCEESTEKVENSDAARTVDVGSTLSVVASGGTDDDSAA